MSSEIGWAQSLAIGNVKTGPGVEQAANGLMMISLTHAMRANMTMIHEQHQRQNQAVVANDPRWARIVARDRTADGHLWYSVLTTGVYCRPSCPSRIANPKNVLLHDTFEEAKATGFRPRRRTSPSSRVPAG
jgi:Metal binding domain of Ada